MVDLAGRHRGTASIYLKIHSNLITLPWKWESDNSNVTYDVSPCPCERWYLLYNEVIEVCTYLKLHMYVMY